MAWHHHCATEQWKVIPGDMHRIVMVLFKRKERFNVNIRAYSLSDLLEFQFENETPVKGSTWEEAQESADKMLRKFEAGLIRLLKMFKTRHFVKVSYTSRSNT